MCEIFRKLYHTNKVLVLPAAKGHIYKLKNLCNRVNDLLKCIFPNNIFIKFQYEIEKNIK